MQIEIDVKQDHIETLARVRSPLDAIEELIWNGLDADAKVIDVQTETNELGGLKSIRVSDNGHGFDRAIGESAFASIGGSPKATAFSTPAGRQLHGKHGKGRLRAFGLGHTVTWITRYSANGKVSEFMIKGTKNRLKCFDLTDVQLSKAPATGVEVRITGIEQNLQSLLRSDEAAQELARRLVLYLKRYPGISIRYDSSAVDPTKLEFLTSVYPLELTDGEKNAVAGELAIVEWKQPMDRKLYFCDANGFSLEETSPGIKAPGFHFTAYLKSSLMTDLMNEGAFGMKDLHPVVADVTKAAKGLLRTHFRAREAERSKDLVEQWQKEQVYPYQVAASDPIGKAEREVFDVCAIKVHEYLPGFEKAEAKSKQLTFRLIREALESNPANLHVILKQVLDLPSEQQAELARLLERSRLAAIINAAKTVVDRLDFLASLDVLLFGELKESLLERRHLHRILVDELWIFGDQYSLGNDDQSLAAVLKEHIGLLERDDLAPEEMKTVKSLEGGKDGGGKEEIVDLMLYRRIPQRQKNTFEHLVVELKRPTCRIGTDELTQIRNYAYTIGDDERFDRRQTKWTFLLIGNSLSKFAKQECQIKGKEFGHIYESEDGAINIFVKTWATIIDEAKWRYEFYREKLELEVNTSDGWDYLKKKHSEHLPKATPVPPIDAKAGLAEAMEDFCQSPEIEATEGSALPQDSAPAMPEKIKD